MLKPIWSALSLPRQSPSIHLKRAMTVAGTGTHSPNDQHILPWCEVDLFIYKEKLLSERWDTQSPHKSALFPRLPRAQWEATLEWGGRWLGLWREPEELGRGLRLRNPASLTPSTPKSSPHLCHGNLFSSVSQFPGGELQGHSQAICESLFPVVTHFAGLAHAFHLLSLQRLWHFSCQRDLHHSSVFHSHVLFQRIPSQAKPSFPGAQSWAE